jgi:hypothetical protein
MTRISGYSLESANVERFMRKAALGLLTSIACSGITLPALADDCSAVWSAMLDSGHTPKSTTVTQTGGDGKKVITRQIQTVTNKYVQTENGKWYAMNIAIKDLDDHKPDMTCRRSGADSVNGEPATVFEFHMDEAGSPSDGKIWVSSRNLVLKSENIIQGVHYATDYDYAHVAPPANFTAMVGR